MFVFPSLMACTSTLDEGSARAAIEDRVAARNAAFDTYDPERVGAFFVPGYRLPGTLRRFTLEHRLASATWREWRWLASHPCAVSAWLGPRPDGAIGVEETCGPHTQRNLWREVDG
ncbi:MAG: hypothetical protein KC656_17995, partial [Myxococcales bacterium]|nr:hypothetical protein [Myxococcales bacterium]